MRTRTGFLWLFMWAVVVFAAVYVAKPPTPVYVVPEGVWQWRVPAGTPAIAWYGRLSTSLLASLAGGMAALALHNTSARLRAALDSRRGIRCMTTVMFATLILAAAWLSFHEWRHWIRK